MPLSLRTLTSKTVAKVIDLGDGNVLNVTYYPARISGKMVAYYGGVTSADQLEALPADERLARIVSPAATLATLLASWDLADDIADDGTVTALVPIDPAHIEMLGIGIQWAILNGVLNDDPNAADAKSSAPALTDGAANGLPNELPSGAIS
jgi:hypothetical protein